MEIVRYGDTCIVEQVNTKKIVEAVVFEFKEKKHITVVLNKSVKLPMVWNGQLYEGRMAGLDFTTAGPTIQRNTTGR
jgi:hypothetical protein